MSVSDLPLCVCVYVRCVCALDTSSTRVFKSEDDVPSSGSPRNVWPCVAPLISTKKPQMPGITHRSLRFEGTAAGESISCGGFVCSHLDSQELQ